MIPTRQCSNRLLRSSFRQVRWRSTSESSDWQKSIPASPSSASSIASHERPSNAPQPEQPAHDGEAGKTDSTPSQETSLQSVRENTLGNLKRHLEEQNVIVKKFQKGKSANIKRRLAKQDADSQEPHYHTVNPNRRYRPLEPLEDQPQPPSLAHGLDRVLFNPGVHYLKDPRTRQYNFPQFLENITQPAEFDYDSLAPYITPSQDKSLIEKARDHRKRYVGSTSTVSSMLSQIYFALSNGKPVDTSILSRAYVSEPNKYTRATRAPASIFLHWKDGVYGIDADKSYDVEETVLMAMGKSMEKVLTLEPAEYERYLKNAEAPLSQKEIDQPEAFAYGMFGRMLLRSQLDCQDPRLPRKTFDLKTRATVPVRLDVHNYLDYVGYNLRRSHGLYESFEREYYDMMRSAFLKYNFQVRIGNMDGILVAYHNTQQIFGFQYISREEIAARLFGNSLMGELVLDKTLQLFHHVLDTATRKYPKKTLRIYFSGGAAQTVDIYVEPMPEPGQLQNGADAEEFFTTKDTTDEVTKYVLRLKSIVKGVPIGAEPVEAVQRRDQWVTRYRMDECPESTQVREEVKSIRRQQMSAYNRSISPSFVNRLRQLSNYNKKSAHEE